MLIPLACNMFGISNDIAMQVVAVGLQTVRGQFHVKHDDCFYLGELRYHDPAMNGDWEHDQKIWETALDQLLPFLAE